MLIARIFAEMAYRPAFRKILHLVVNNQDRERVIRLRNEWVPIDPRNWDIDMDLSIAVGLGHGTQQQRAVMARTMLDVQEKIVSYQGGTKGPLVTLDNLYSSLKSFSEANGFKGDQFFSDPSGYEEPEGPSPQEQAFMEQAELERAKFQQESQEAVAKLQQEREQFQEEMRLKWAEYEAKYEVEGAKLEVDARKSNGGEVPDVTERMQPITDMLADVAQQLGETAANMNRPREIIRDERNRIVGAK